MEDARVTEDPGLGFAIPDARIARYPRAERDASSLLWTAAETEEPLSLHCVRDLPELLQRPCLWVLNRSAVLKARLKVKRPSGGRIEVLLNAPAAQDAEGRLWTAMLRGLARLQVGEALQAADGSVLRFEGRDADGLGLLTLPCGLSELPAWLSTVGEVPLPPYFRREAEAIDETRYQTVFAAEPGSVAAPTAGLHFTPELLEALQGAGHELAYLTLHVGAGTFTTPAEGWAAEALHEERYWVEAPLEAALRRARREGRPVIAVGTTATRALESAWDPAQDTLRVGPGRTRLFIKPGYRWQVVDGLLTNFHLPESTLLALVMAVLGVERTRAAYAKALESGCAFYSYGDAMLALRPGCRLRNSSASQGL